MSAILDDILSSHGVGLGRDAGFGVKWNIAGDNVGSLAWILVLDLGWRVRKVHFK